MKSKYVTQVTERSVCPICNKHLTFLCHARTVEGQPMFYICWNCRTVAEVGKGPVPQEEE